MTRDVGVAAFVRSAANHIVNTKAETIIKQLAHSHESLASEEDIAQLICGFRRWTLPEMLEKISA